MRILSALFLLASACHGQISNHLESDLRKALEGRAVLIRHFYQGPKLVYDANGQINTAKEGAWPIDGFIGIKKVRIKKGDLKIEGERLAVFFAKHNDEVKLRPYKVPI